MLTRFSRLTAHTVVAVAVLAAAETNAQTWHVTVDGAASPHRMSSSDLGTGATAIVSATDKPIIEVSCRGGANCTLVSGRYSVVDEKGSRITVDTLSRKEAPTTAKAVFTFDADLIPAVKGTSFLLQFASGSANVEFPVARAPEKPPQTPTGKVPLNDLLTTDCRRELRQYDQWVVYSERENKAVFVVTPTGQVYLRPRSPQVIDENDLIEVHVVGDAALLPRLKVTRTSAFRMPNQISILGDEVKVGVKEQSRVTPECDVRVVRLSDFAAGRGEVKIEALTGDDGASPIGAFEFGVNRLYTGAFGLGPVYTWVRDPRFGLVARGSDSLVSVREDRAPRVLYVLTYTHYIWGKRDVEKQYANFLQRICPMLGIVVNDVRNNAILGLSYDVLGSNLFVSSGVHIARVQSLNPDSDLKIGDTFKGTSQQIPVRTEWTANGFIGVTLDLRAAVKLFGSIFSAAGAAQ